MGLNIVNAIWKPFFEFSKFTEKANKRERCNLDDMQGLEVSYGLSSPNDADLCVFQQGLVEGDGVLCYIQPYDNQFTVTLYFFI